MIGGLAVEQALGRGRVVHLTGGRDHTDQLAERIGEQVELAAQPAARAANRLSVEAPLPPAAC
jgi:hypothetical protein